MSSLSRPLRAVLATAALALVLTGCGGGNENGSTDGGGDLSYEDSPLMKYFGEAGGGQDFNEEEAQAQAEEMNAQVEQAVATCMAEQGFEYIPNDTSNISVAFGPEESDLDPIENARQNGYGVYTQQEQLQDPDAEEFVDPNQAYTEGMSESELTAYHEALNGPMVEFDPEADVETAMEYNWEDYGCYGKAQNEVYESGDSQISAMNAVYSDPQWAELIAELGNLYTDIADNPALVELDATWSTCMADAGHPDFANPMAASESVYTASNQQWEEHSDDPEYTGPTGSELEELKKNEIELAVADFTCQAEVDYSDEQLRAQFDAEQAFIDENKAELEAFSQALASASK